MDTKTLLYEAEKDLFYRGLIDLSAMCESRSQAQECAIEVLKLARKEETINFVDFSINNNQSIDLMYLFSSYGVDTRIKISVMNVSDNTEIEEEAFSLDDDKAEEFIKQMIDLYFVAS